MKFGQESWIAWMYLCAKFEVDRIKTVGDSGIASLEGEERRESRERE